MAGPVLPRGAHQGPRDKHGHRAVTLRQAEGRRAEGGTGCCPGPSRNDLTDGWAFHGLLENKRHCWIYFFKH